MIYKKVEDGYVPQPFEPVSANLKVRLFISNRNKRELKPVFSTIDKNNNQIRVYLDTAVRDPSMERYKVAKVLKVTQVTDDDETLIEDLEIPPVLDQHISVFDPDVIENPEVTLMKGENGWYFAKCNTFDDWPFRRELMGPDFNIQVGFRSENTQVRLNDAWEISTRDHQYRRLCISHQSDRITSIKLWGVDEELTKVHIPGDSDLWKFLYIEEPKEEGDE